MKDLDINSNKNNFPLIDNPLIELSLLNKSSDNEDKKDNNDLQLNNIEEIPNSKKRGTISSSGSHNEDDEEDKRESWNILPANFFSFNLIFYILMFFLLFLSSFNFSFLTIPYIFITLILCLLSYLPESNKIYYILYLFRIFLFPIICIYTFGVLIFKVYIFSKIVDNVSYGEENKDFILNMGIFYFQEKETPINITHIFKIIRSIGPEIIIFIYTLFFSLILLIGEIKCSSQYPIAFDIEKRYGEKTPKKIRRNIKFTYILLLIFAYFNPSFTCFYYILLSQICLALLSNDRNDYINKRYCVMKFIVFLIFIIFIIQIGLNNILQIYKFQIKYLINDLNENEKTNNIWINCGINRTYNIDMGELIYHYFGYAFGILSFMSIENLVRILSNGIFNTNEEYYKYNEDKRYVDENEENSWIVRKIKNLFLFILKLLEERNIISHLCRIVAIIHINYCQNIYSFAVFIWLFFSFICNEITSTKYLCVFFLIPSLIISSLCYNLSNFNIFNTDYSSEKDIFTFLGLKKLNKFFYFSFIICHIFFLLIITFLSSLESNIELINIEQLKINSDKKNINENEELKSGVLSDINLLSVDILVTMNTKKTNKRKSNINEKNFENKFKDLLQKKIKNDDNKDKKNQNKDEKLTIINILIKILFLNINKINLILVYLVSVSSINIVHLLLVIIFILNVVSSIISSKMNKNNIENGQKEESQLQYYVTKITLILIQLSFLFEFIIDLYKCFFIYSKPEKEQEEIAKILKFILNYEEKINSNSFEALLFIITYCFYFEYQVYLIKSQKTKYKYLEVLLNDQNICFYLYFKSVLKYTFFIYDYFVNIINHLLIWIYTFIFIFMLCYFEINILFSIQLLLFLVSVYLLLVKIQASINRKTNPMNKKIKSKKDIFVTYIFLFFSVSNTIIVYLYQFICHNYWYEKVENIFLENEKKLSYIGLKKYTDNLKIKLLPFFISNFISILFLNELDNYQKRIEKELYFLNDQYHINDINNNEKEKKEINNVDNNLDYTELFEKCQNTITNNKFKLFGINIILILTKIYWIFLFFTICTLFNSYYFSLSMSIYIIIFGISFIRMFNDNLKKKNYKYSFHNNNNSISDESLEIMNRMDINKKYREIAFRFLVAFSFLIFLLYYIYGIFDISISYCNPEIWIGCNNEDNNKNNVNENENENNNDNDNVNQSINIINFIKSISFIFGVYYNANEKHMLSINWIHLFLCFLFCFDVYIQKIENFFSNIKTQKLLEQDKKALELIFLRQKFLESQVDVLIHPNKASAKNLKQSLTISESLGDENEKKNDEDLSQVIKSFDLSKINEKRKAQEKKLMHSIKYIFEEVIILALIITGIMKINIWSIPYFIFVYFLIFTKRTIKKFFYFYCFLIVGIILQIILFVINIQKSIIQREVDDTIFVLIKDNLGIPLFNSEQYYILYFIFGLVVEKELTNTLYCEYILVTLIYIYLDNFTYNIFYETNTIDKLICPFVKGNILHDSMLENPSLKNREIYISRKDFIEIKRVVKKNTFIENVSAFRYDDFLIALNKLKVKDENKEEDKNNNQDNENHNIISERQKLLIQLNSKTQQIFSFLEFIEIILYLSSHNFVLIINIMISMMIPGIISIIYIIVFIIFLLKSNSLIQGKRYYYPHFTKYIRLILLIDISLQLIVQYSVRNGLIFKISNIFGLQRILIFENHSIRKDKNSFAFLIAKTVSFFFISLQILIYSSVNYIEYYFIYLLTLKVNRYKIAKINAFKFNNERIHVMKKSLSLKEEAYKTMNEIQYLLEDWRKIFAKSKKKLSLKRKSMPIKEEEISEFVNEEEAKSIIKDWIMDKFLINIYSYIHKYSSPYQTLGKNEMYELEKNIIQGETKPITYIEFLIDFYLDALSPFNLTQQGLSIVESIINGSREQKRQEIKKIKEMEEKKKEEKLKENENLNKKYELLNENVKRIDSIIEKLKVEINNEFENELCINESENEDENESETERKNSLNLSLSLQNIKQNIDEEKIDLDESDEKKENKERNSSLIEVNEIDFSKVDKKKLLTNYEKAKEIILEEKEKIKKKLTKYEEICKREKKHNKNKYLDDEFELNGFKKELNKIDLNSPKFYKFEVLRKKSILFTRYLKNSFIFRCILLDLKSCLTYNFHWFCYLLMLINHMNSASLISLFYPMTIFCYAILEYPRPVKTYWKLCLYYTFSILFIKLFLTLKIFTLFLDEEIFIGFLNTLNDYKIGFKYCKLTLTKEFFSYIIFDTLVIISLMIYINILVMNGTWNKREQDIECIYSAMERVSISNSVELDDEGIKNFNKEFLSSIEMKDNNYLENIKTITEKASGNHRRGGRVAFVNDFLEKKMKKTEVNNKKKEKLLNIEEEEKNTENKEIKRNYFERLFPKNRNEKPGKEYYPMYTAALLIILAYILFFFNYMVRDENYGDLSLDVQQFNGLMVIYFIIHVIIVICDRAILLFQNQKNVKYKYYLYKKADFTKLENIIDFRKKTKDDKNEYFKNNIHIIEDQLIELFPKKKRWKNHSLVIPIQHFSEIRDQYYISYKQIETFNKPLFFKYLLYICIVLFVHFNAFLYFPMKGNINLGNEIFCTEGDKCNDFTSNKFLLFFYIFYLLYLIPSALQIKYGFNDMKKKSVMKRNHTELNNLLVTIFLKIPFLNEIKNILDWTLTSTSLDLGQWIQFESIYEAIFSTYSDDRDEENIIGQKIEKARKIQKGCVLSFILISALIFPLIIFSSINPTNIINSVYDAKLKVDLSFTYYDEENKKYTLFQNNRPETITEMTDDIFEEFDYINSVKTRNFPKKQIQTIKFYETSETNWDLVFPHIQNIINELNISNPYNKIKSINLVIETQFTRPLPAEAQTVTDEIIAEIYNDKMNLTSEEINKALLLSDALTNCLDTNINFYDIYSPSRKLSGSINPKIIEDSKHFSNLGIQLGFMGCDNSTGKNNFLQSYFTLKAIKNSYNNKTALKYEPISFHIFSETISPTTSSYSVYAFYTAVILVFGEYVRDFFSGEPEKVTLNEMPEPKKMIDLCEGITIARSSQDFKMEKKLYFILIELLREPTYLKEITKSSVERFEEREENTKFITSDDLD